MYGLIIKKKWLDKILSGENDEQIFWRLQR